MTIAFLFPGQGSQAVGMAQDLAKHYPVARETLVEADDVLGFPLSRLCFEGPAEILTDTINAQPALLAASIATLRVIQNELPELPAPAFLAGHSLGEYSALVAAGSLTFADGLRLVSERGRLMKEAGQQQPGGMAAILSLGVDQLDLICRKASETSGGVVQVANDNCPGQIVISGDEATLAAAMSAAAAAGARKVIRLAVSIAAHSPLMAPAAAALRQAIALTTIRPPLTPVISNVHAGVLNSAAAIRDDLVAQLTSPVRWTESMQSLVAAGASRVIEVGSGDVLNKLMRRIDRSVKRFSVGDPAGIDTLRSLT